MCHARHKIYASDGGEEAADQRLDRPAHIPTPGRNARHVDADAILADGARGVDGARRRQYSRRRQYLGTRRPRGHDPQGEDQMRYFVRWWETLGRAERIVAMSLATGGLVAMVNSTGWAIAVAYMTRQKALAAIEIERARAYRHYPPAGGNAAAVRDEADQPAMHHAEAIRELVTES